jgi:hypothetical protein
MYKRNFRINFFASFRFVRFRIFLCALYRFRIFLFASFFASVFSFRFVSLPYFSFRFITLPYFPFRSDFCFCIFFSLCFASVIEALVPSFLIKTHSFFAYFALFSFDVLLLTRFASLFSLRFPSPFRFANEIHCSTSRRKKEMHPSVLL